MPEERESRSVVDSTAKKAPRVKFKDVFFRGDLKTAMADGLLDVIVPRASELFISFVNTVLRAVMYGDGYYPSDDRRGRRDSTYIDYGRNYDRDRYRERDYDTRRDSLPIKRGLVDRLDTSTYPHTTMRNAENVVKALQDEIRRKGKASLLDFYDFSGGETVSTDDNYGWTSIPSNPRIEYDRGYYYIYLPRPYVIDR